MASTLKLEIVTPEGKIYSEEVEMVTLLADTGFCSAPSVKPAIVNAAGDFTECCLIFAHVSVSGFHVRVTFC